MVLALGVLETMFIIPPAFNSCYSSPSSPPVVVSVFFEVATCFNGSKAKIIPHYADTMVFLPALPK